MDSSTIGALFIVGMGLVVLTVFITLWIGTKKKSRKGRAVRSNGLEREAAAEQILLKLGFKLEKPKRRYGSLTVDDEEVKFWGQPDWLARSETHLFVVEVKTGGSVKVTTAATRRQLLEYAVLYPEADAILLVNMETETVQRVSFPMLRQGSR